MTIGTVENRIENGIRPDKGRASAHFALPIQGRPHFLFKPFNFGASRPAPVLAGDGGGFGGQRCPCCEDADVRPSMASLG